MTRSAYHVGAMGLLFFNLVVVSKASGPVSQNIINAESKVAQAVAAQQAAAKTFALVAHNLKNAFESSPEYVKAKTNLVTATSAYDVARKAVIDHLQSNEDYKAAIAARDDATESVKDARDAGVTGEPMIDLAQNALDARAAVSKLEETALANNSAFQDAKAKLAVAAGVMLQLDKKFQDALALDQGYQRVKMELHQATAELDAADEKLAAAREAEAEAYDREAQQLRTSKIGPDNGH